MLCLFVSPRTCLLWQGSLRVKAQSFGEITTEKGTVFQVLRLFDPLATIQRVVALQTGNFSGILGLAYPSLSAYDIVPVFDSIMDQELLSMNMFSFYFSK